MQEENNNFEFDNPQEEITPHIDYYIRPGEVYEVRSNEYNGKTFYKIPITIIKKDQKYAEINKTVQFKRDVYVPNGSKIKILNAKEDYYFKSGDRFNPIWIVRIYDFEIVDRGIEEAKQALSDFNTPTDDFDLPF